jgi:hypothetical protein
MTDPRQKFVFKVESSPQNGSAADGCTNSATPTGSNIGS